MKTLEEIFKTNTGKRIHRHDHVLKIYDEHFSRYRNTPVKFLEMGITEGGSLLMWQEYFGKEAQIYGLDASSSAEAVASDQIKILQADQGDQQRMEILAQEIGDLDIIVDDCSHESPKQIISFEVFFPILNKNGIYAIEDLHCSYRYTHEGGYKLAGSIIEYTKNIIDYLHEAELTEEEKAGFPNYMNSLYGIHFFRNVLLVENNINASRTSSPLLTGEGTERDEYHNVTGNRFTKRSE